MVDERFLVELFLVVGLAVGVSWAVSFAFASVVRRRVTTLEFAVADLEDRLLKEVKARAGNAGVRARKEQQELEELMLQKASTPKADQPWWYQHVHPDLTKG